MAKGLVIYDSKTGNIEKMAKAIGEGLSEAGLVVEVKKVDEAKLDDCVAADAIVMGSSTYFGNLTGKAKAFVDKTVGLWPGELGKLKDKVGAAFTSCAAAEGGNETTYL